MAALCDADAYALATLDFQITRSEEADSVSHAPP
jgi:hypothetical protein